MRKKYVIKFKSNKIELPCNGYYLEDCVGCYDTTRYENGQIGLEKFKSFNFNHGGCVLTQDLEYVKIFKSKLSAKLFKIFNHYGKDFIVEELNKNKRN